MAFTYKDLLNNFSPHITRVLLLVTAFLASACDRCGGDYNTRIDNQIIFQLFHQGTRQPVIGIFPDTAVVKLLDEDNRRAPYSEIRTTGEIAFAYLDENVYQQPLGIQQTKHYYLQLSSQDTDTITVKYELTRNKCEVIVVRPETFQILYNQALQYTGRTGAVYVELVKQ